jgi:hypothetical protein
MMCEMMYHEGADEIACACEKCWLRLLAERDQAIEKASELEASLLFTQGQLTRCQQSAPSPEHRLLNTAELDEQITRRGWKSWSEGMELEGGGYHLNLILTRNQGNAE